MRTGSLREMAWRFVVEYAGGIARGWTVHTVARLRDARDWALAEPEVLSYRWFAMPVQPTMTHCPACGHGRCYCATVVDPPTHDGCAAIPWQPTG